MKFLKTLTFCALTTLCFFSFNSVAQTSNDRPWQTLKEFGGGTLQVDKSAGWGQDEMTLIYRFKYKENQNLDSLQFDTEVFKFKMACNYDAKILERTLYLGNKLVHIFNYGEGVERTVKPSNTLLWAVVEKACPDF